eukprot:COSAG04_NODE_579_length_12424_cov_20.826369_4_plen_70_part_00
MLGTLRHRVGLPHYAFAAFAGWAISFYTFQPLLKEQARKRQQAEGGEGGAAAEGAAKGAGAPAAETKSA